MMPKWLPSLSTLEVARSIGEVIDIEAILPGVGIPTVQCLTPRQTNAAPRNQYSGTYGLGEFPLHTDLAHWARPPRYFLLRCKVGSTSVFTRLLPVSTLAPLVGTESLTQALTRPARRPHNGALCVLPVVLPQDGFLAIRWDPLFLVPMNEPAQQLAEFMSAQSWEQNCVVTITFSALGDSLILDNWRLLHGRSQIPDHDRGRVIERVYLSRILQ